MERKRSFAWVLVTAAMLWLAIIFMVVSAMDAHAQMGGDIFSARESGQPHGKYIIGWNTTGTEIAAGTLVMADTQSAGPVPQVAMGKGFKTWSGATTDFNKILGVLIDPATGHAQARIMVKGFMSNVKVMSGITGGSTIRPSLTAAGRLTAWSASTDTVYYKHPVGVFQRYARTDSSIAYCWLDFGLR